MTLRLGRIGSTVVQARPSLLVAAVLLVVLLAPQLTPVGSSPYLLAAVLVIGLYASVLVHELAHVAAAKAYGMPVRAVTLHLMGGETSIEGGSRRPAQEIVTAGVGPLASLVVGLAAHVAAGAAGDLAYVVLWSLGWINVLLGVFNLLPGLPLDGGRVLRGAVWGATGSSARGWSVTAWAGRVTAVVVVVGVLIVRRDEGTDLLVDLLLALLIGALLWTGAEQARRQARWSGRIEGLDATALARPLPETGALPSWPRLAADSRGETLVQAMSARPAERYLLVDGAGSPVGVLDRADVDAAYRRNG